MGCEPLVVPCQDQAGEGGVGNAELGERDVHFSPGARRGRHGHTHRRPVLAAGGQSVYLELLPAGRAAINKEAQVGEAGGIEFGVVQLEARPAVIGDRNAVAPRVGVGGGLQVHGGPRPVIPAGRQRVGVDVEGADGRVSAARVQARRQQGKAEHDGQEPLAQAGAGRRGEAEAR